MSNDTEPLQATSEENSEGVGGKCLSLPEKVPAFLGQFEFLEQLTEGLY